MMIKTKKEIELMRVSGRIAADIMEEVVLYIREGITGLDIDRFILNKCKDRNVKPAFFDFGGYPNNCCISVNEAVIHCRPTDKFFMGGDVVKIDFGISYKGYCSDIARTVVVGAADSSKQAIINAVKSIFDDTLSVLYPGKRIGDISHSIHKFTMLRGYDIIQEFSSHGIGTKVHEPPQIPHYGFPNSGGWIFSNMTFAIEPIIRECKGTIKKRDDWCIVVDPCCLTAHYEDTVLITDNGPEVLTKC